MPIHCIAVYVPHIDVDYGIMRMYSFLAVLCYLILEGDFRLEEVENAHLHAVLGLMYQNT